MKNRIFISLLALTLSLLIAQSTWANTNNEPLSPTIQQFQKTSQGENPEAENEDNEENWTEDTPLDQDTSSQDPQTTQDDNPDPTEDYNEDETLEDESDIEDTQTDQPKKTNNITKVVLSKKHLQIKTKNKNTEKAKIAVYKKENGVWHKKIQINKNLGKTTNIALPKKLNKGKYRTVIQIKNKTQTFVSTIK